MRTTLEIDEDLVEKVVQATGEGTKSKAVNKALRAYLRDVRMKRLLASQGNLDLDLDDWYDLRHAGR
jgi:Arc/MetJ family transcription regulator